MNALMRVLLSSVCLLATSMLSINAQQLNPGLYGGMRWRMIGPYRGGRTVGAAGVPGRPNVFYIGVNNGGVWKTDDYGRVWTPIFDKQPTQSIGALAVAPSDPNTIYVGSGEGLQRPDLSVGDGIYKSVDGGLSWQHLGLRDGRQIGAIIVDPRNPGRLFVAVLGHPYGPNEERGVYRSTDGGLSFQRVLYKDENTGAIDLAFDPSNAQTVYAVLWAARQGPWEYNNAYQGPNSGLFKSVDGGTTWRQLSGGLPGVKDALGRMGIGIAPNDHGRIYALVEATQRAGGLYRSDDAGESWQRVNNDVRVWGRGDDFASVRVDPNNRDIVFVANIASYRSSDGGRNFTAFKGAPGGDDYHTIWINPDNPQIILLASDQGATLTVNGGRTWSSWYNQPTGQMFHVSADNRFPYWVYGGQQESGSAGVASRSDYGEITFREWHPVGVEEYGYAAPDPLNPGVIYGGKVTRYDEKTGGVQNVGPVALRTGKYRFDRTAPIIFSPADPHVLLFAAQVLFRTVNGGHSWEVISPDLTRENPGIPANLGIYSEMAAGVHRGVIYSIAPSPLNVDLIWIGTDDGLIQVTRDGGKNWSNVTPPEMSAWSKVTQIDASHFDTQTAYASVSRFRLDDLHPYIYRTHDGGRTWQKIVSGLADNASVNVVREDPVRKGLLYAGSELAVYVSFNDGENWQSLQLNLPASSMRDLVIHDDDAIVATHGRSFWILDDVTPLRQIDPHVADSEAFLFRPKLTYRVRRNQNTDTPLPPEEPAGENPPDGAILCYYLKSDTTGPVALEIFDQANNLVRRFSSTDKPEVEEKDLEKEIALPTYWVRPPQILSARGGMHRFVWDLRFPPPQTLEHEYPISAIYRDTPRLPLGPFILPGVYTMKLQIGGRSYTQSLTVKMDPRVKTTPEGLAQQFSLARMLVERMGRNYGALMQIRNFRKKLTTARKQAGQGALAEAISIMDAKLSAFEGRGSRTRSSATGEEVSLTSLDSDLRRLYEIIEGADATPTTQAAAAVAELLKALDGQLDRWKDLQNRDVPALNEQLKQAGLPPLALQ
ncbi:MAG TPA: glycoside hydrolase [Acidobacteriota bacterium]|nr:glycoside hydrolase [Acidobacteriota bacterium]